MLLSEYFFLFYRVIGQAATCIERSLGMKFSMDNLKETSFDENEDNSSGQRVVLASSKVLKNQIPKFMTRQKFQKRIKELYCHGFYHLRSLALLS